MMKNIDLGLNSIGSQQYRLFGRTVDNFIDDFRFNVKKEKMCCEFHNQPTININGIKLNL